MAVEDLAAFRAINGTTVLYPADGNSTVALTRAMAELDGISYLRSTRESTPRLYGPDEAFPVGGSKRLGDGNDVTLVGAGVTLHQCLEARDALAAEGIEARVLDCYSVKPIDAQALRAALDETGAIVVAEDHRVEGGLGDAVLDALSATGPLHGRVVKLGVTAIPGSGTAAEMRRWAGIDADAIGAAARDVARRT
jgi:transketolase